MFEQSLVAVPRHSGRGATFVISATFQVVVVGTLLLAPLFLIENPALLHLDARLLAPPRPAPPPSVKLVDVPKSLYKRVMETARLTLPLTIPPKAVPIIDDLNAGPEPAIEASGIGIPGGIGGPDESGALGLFRNARPAPPPVEAAKPVEKPVAAAAQPSKPITVGGDVQEAKIIRRVLPVYPAIAKAARISGTVRLLGVLSRDGHIRELQVISGHPLLVTAALDAVNQWVYKPTLLNGQPVEVIAPIEVHFRLN